jgi:hypothetical protein
MLGQMGLSWFNRSVGGLRTLWHGGSTNGQMALLQCAPSRAFALALLTNANPHGDQLNQEIAKWAFKHYLGAEEPVPTPQARTPEQLAAYTGRYHSTLSDAELSVRDGVLDLQLRATEKMREISDNPPPPPPPMPVTFYAEDKIVVTEGPQKGSTAEFLRHPDGSIAWLRMSRLLRRMEH